MSDWSTDMNNPANPASPLSPANPISPLNPNGIYYQETGTPQKCDNCDLPPACGIIVLVVMVLFVIIAGIVGYIKNR